MSLTKLLKDGLLYLYAAALLLSAALLFMVQPMVARMILPFLGGSPAVWNTCLFFFNRCCCWAISSAHFAGKWLGIKRHMLIHVAPDCGRLVFFARETSRRLTGAS
jgi:hypothetical protein